MVSEESDYKQEQSSKEIDRLNNENWLLKMRIWTLETYIKFKSLWEDFVEMTK